MRMGLVARPGRVVFLGFLSGDDRRFVRHRLARRPLGCAQNDLTRSSWSSAFARQRRRLRRRSSAAWVSFFLAGLGYSFLNPASSIGVMTWFHRDERATAMGIKQTGVPSGGVLAAILAPSLVLLIGWRGSLAALGIFNFALRFFVRVVVARAGERVDRCGSCNERR